MSVFKPPSATEFGHLDHLAAIGSYPAGGGITRDVSTPQHTQATERGRSDSLAGFEARSDAFGTSSVGCPGRDPAAPEILMGSDIDTTLNVRRYDGVPDFIGGMEAHGALPEAGWEPWRTLEVVGEGPRFGLGCIGTRGLFGELARDAQQTLATPAEPLPQIAVRLAERLGHAGRMCGLSA
jgi:hypothetical protein